MNNQDNSFHLNPTAREFVPTFGGATFAAAPTSALNNQEFEPVQEQQPQRHYQQQHYNNNYNNNYSKPHYNSGGRGGGRGRGGYNNHYNGHRGGHNQYDNHRSHYSNDPNIDPLEMEARCEAVIEILQDDKIRNVINPNYDNQDSHPGSVTNAEENVESQFDDEEDLLEMMAMQEECRLEMMKFYIQSQNPSLFENVYHGVSYPENHPANAPPSSAPPASDPSHQTTAPSFPAPSSAPVSSAPPTNNNSNNNTSSSVKDQIINDLSINAPEFDPTQLAGLSLNDK